MAESGGLQAASLWVSVGAALGPMVQGLMATVDAVEKSAKRMGEHLGRVSGAIGALNGGLMAFAGAAAGSVALAAQHSAKAAHELERLKMATAVLGREVGDTFVPLIRDMVGWVKTAIATWRGLDSGLKENLVTAARWAGVIAVGGLALQKATSFAKGFADGTVALIGIAKDMGPVVSDGYKAVSKGARAAADALTALSKAEVGATLARMGASVKDFGSSIRTFPSAISGLGSSFMKVVPQIAAVALPLLAVAAAVGAIVLLAGSLYKSWDDITYLWNESTSGIVDSMRELGEKAAGFFGELMSSVKGFITDVASAMLDSIFDRVKMVAAFLEAVARKLGREELANNLHAVQDLSAQAFFNKLKDGARQVGDIISEKAKAAGAAVSAATKDVREGVAYGLKHSVEGAQMLGQDLAKALHLDELMALKDKLLGAAPKLGDGDSVSLPGEVDASAVGRDTSADAMLRQLASGKESPLIAAVRSKIAADANAIADAMAQAREALKGKLVSRLGDIVDIVDSFTQGMAAGGPLGGALAVLGDLLTRSEGFKTLIEMVNNLLQLVADSLGQLLIPLQPLVGAIGYLVQAVMGNLSPILQMFLEALEPLSPVLVMVGEVLVALQPLFQMMAAVLRLTEMPMRLLVEVGLRLFFEGVKLVALGILHIAKAISGVWNGIINAVQSVLATLGSIEVFGKKPFSFLLDWATAIGDAKISTEGLDASISKLKDATWDAAKAKADETAEVLKSKAAVDKMTESLTAVPPRWRYALRAFEAQNARTGPAGGPVLPSSQPSAGGGAPASTPAAPGQSQPTPATPGVVLQPGSVVIQVRDEYGAAAALEKRLDDLAWRKRGSRGRSYAFAYGE